MRGGSDSHKGAVIFGRIWTGPSREGNRRWAEFSEFGGPRAERSEIVATPAGQGGQAQVGPWAVRDFLAACLFFCFLWILGILLLLDDRKMKDTAQNGVPQ